MGPYRKKNLIFSLSLLLRVFLSHRSTFSLLHRALDAARSASDSFRFLSMVRLTKKSKLALEEHSEGHSDRISNLPESVLHHILSFLNTKQAAQTSVLSKQWQHLWTWLPNFDLTTNETQAPDYESFGQIALQILGSRRTPCIRKFRLCSYHHLRGSLNLSSLLLCADVARNVEELEFYSGNYLFELPCSIFNCKNLVFLKLGGRILINLSSLTQLPILKVLRLKYVVFEDMDAFGNLIRSCPVLEDLRIKDLLIKAGEYYRYPDEVTVNAPTLKRLVLHQTTCQTELVGMDNLVEANLDLVDLGDEYGKCQTVLGSVRHVKVLVMASDTMWAFRSAPSWGKFPEFHNVVELTLTELFSVCTLFSDFLHKFPFLKHLTFEKNYDSDRREKLGILGNPPCWAPPQMVPKCLSFHLLKFTIHEIDCSDDDLEFTRYILKHSKALRNVTITPSDGLGMKKQFYLVQKLLKLERASSCCQLDFVPLH